jgi:VWFA-related protein
MSRHHSVIALLIAGASLSAAARQDPPPQLPQPRPPIFRGGAHYVRVDAYPTAKDGRIIEGLSKDDFEIFEDGRPQAIESAEFVTFDTWTPEAERKDPRTQQDAYDLAADPTWRVFVIVIDPDAYGMEGRHYMRTPLHEFVDRNLGPRDLFGVLTTRSSWTDLTLGQRTTAAGAIFDTREWINPPEYDERYLLYYECGLGSMIGRKKLDDTYALLEGLVKLLALVRQEKKSIVFVTNGFASPEPVRGNASAMPEMPRIGITNGRVGEIPRAGDRVGTVSRSSLCAAERMRLANIDFGRRFRDLLKDARAGNVAFYPISPSGLQGIPLVPGARGFDMRAYQAQNSRLDTLRTLASETDGLAIVNTNDLAGGMKKIANDLDAYYVLGYYTTNTKWDGGVRSIKVRLKPGKTIRARRQYRAPTQEEIAAFTAPASVRAAAPPTAEETALAALSRASPNAAFVTYAARAAGELSIVLEVPAGASAWPAGTPIDAMAESSDGEVLGTARAMKGAGRVAQLRVPTVGDKPAAVAMVKVRVDGVTLTDRVTLPPASSLVGDPLAFRNGTPAAVLACTRTDGVRLEWPVLADVETARARLLDRRGQPLPVPLAVARRDGPGARRLVAELSLAPLGRGDYLVELTAASGGVTERKLFGVRVN